MKARISVPSYVIAGSYVENLYFLRQHTNQRNVELLFFIFDDDVRKMLDDEIKQIREYSNEFTFTLHLPDQISAEHEELLQKCDDFVSSYVVHPPRTINQIDDFVQTLTTWRRNYGADRFLLENTTIDNFNSAFAALEKSYYGQPRVCADIGHLLFQNKDISSWVSQYFNIISEFHIHGYDGKKDHVPFTKDEAWLKELKPFIQEFDSVIEIELFSWQDLEKSIDIIKSVWG